MQKHGSEKVSFDTILLTGTHTSMPHGTPSDRKVQAGDFVLFDFGATYKGYHSDMTRTIAIGKVTDDMKKMYDAVLFANLDAMKAIRADISGKVADSVARSTLDAWGFGKYFGHGLGHGVGLEIHEAPSASPSSQYTLKEGMILTVEPGAYISGKYGVRTEDMVVVTNDGCRNLTNTTKDLIIID